MNRPNLLDRPLLTVACFALVMLFAAPLTSFAQNGDAAEKDQPMKDDDDATLPIKKVVLFNSGVGFYQHEGQVTGNADVTLKFDVDEINDLLKSMVLRDLDGGTISTVTYGSKDPITRTLKTFAIDLTEDPSMAALLRQVRGERVEVQAVDNITGIIVSVETREIRIGEDQTVEQEFVNLLTPEGLRSVSLADVGRIRFLNEDLQAEFNKALTVLAQSHDTDKKTVGLKFLGNGDRQVRVGYIQESPVWKTSYRLVLDEEGKPFLQGWAIVENTTDNDWDDVRLTLVSGRPISFMMDLYEPLYVPRPLEQLDLYASLRPKTYDQDLAGKADEFARMANQRGRELAEEMTKRESRLAGAPAPSAPPADAAYGYAAEAEMDDRRSFNLQQGVQSAAAGGDVGELFEYVIGTPVSLERQRSAMLPIVNSEIEGEKLAIYNENTHPKHPLNGLRMQNTTGLHLMQGPITVFDGGIYAGDAKISDIAAGSERLLSYAMDLNTEVSFETKGAPEQLVSVKIVRGNLITDRKYFRSREYTIKNSNAAAKKVLIEYPFDSQWELKEPEEPAEKTRDLYRFAVDAEPGEPKKFTIREERTASQSIALTNIDDNTIVYYLRTKIISDEVKAALEEVVKRKDGIDKVVRQRQEKERQIAAIEQDQNRIRQNMDKVPRDSDLYRRYLEKFTEQEDSMEALREEIKQLAEQEQQLRRDLNTYLQDVTLS